MIAVTKRTEPQSLQQYRLQEGAVYDGENFTTVKQGIRDQLVAEQGYLCAYCMGRIEPDDRNMKVEHWHSRKKYPAQQLNYTNLLGCCSGNEGQPDTHAHCDTKKRNADLLYNRVCKIKCVNGHSLLSLQKEKSYGQKARTDSRQPEGTDRPAHP